MDLDLKIDQDLLRLPFTKSDAYEIRRIARAKWNQLEPRVSAGEEDSWRQIVSDFEGSSYWGFSPVLESSQPLANKDDKLGVSLILITFITATFGLMSVVWLGQNYTNTGETSDLLLLLLAIGAIASMYIIFLFRNRHHGVVKKER